MPEKTLEERVKALERQVAFLLGQWQRSGVPSIARRRSGVPSIARRLPDAIGKPLTEPWIPTVEGKL